VTTPVTSARRLRGVSNRASLRSAWRSRRRWTIPPSCANVVGVSASAGEYWRWEYGFRLAMLALVFGALERLW